MKPNTNDGAICADSSDEKDDIGAEIDLYTELISFSELPAEEKLQSISALQNAAEEAKKRAEEELAKKAALAAAQELVETEPAVTPSSFPAQKPIKQSETIPAATEPSATEAPSKLGEAAERRPVSSPKPSGPLSGFNLPPNIVYTGTIAAGACISCGAETGEGDLFCVACGGFVDDIETSVIVPKCRECKKEISSEEVFCPFCGAATPA